MKYKSTEIVRTSSDNSEKTEKETLFMDEKTAKRWLQQFETKLEQMIQILDNDDKDSILKGLDSLNFIPINKELVDIEQIIFRAVDKYNGIDITSKSSFSYIPCKLNNKRKPCQGRFNVECQSIFYGSHLFQTCFDEIKKVTENTTFFVGLWKIKKQTQYTWLNLHNVPNGPYYRAYSLFKELMLRVAEKNMYEFSSYFANKIFNDYPQSYHQNNAKK